MWPGCPRVDQVAVQPCRACAHRPAFSGWLPPAMCSAGHLPVWNGPRGHGLCGRGGRRSHAGGLGGACGRVGCQRKARLAMVGWCPRPACLACWPHTLSLIIQSPPSLLHPAGVCAQQQVLAVRPRQGDGEGAGALLPPPLLRLWLLLPHPLCCRWWWWFCCCCCCCLLLPPPLLLLAAGHSIPSNHGCPCSQANLCKGGPSKMYILPATCTDSTSHSLPLPFPGPGVH